MHSPGFTLIELLVVIVITVILAALLTPTFSGALRDTDLRRAQLHAGQVRLALNTALAQNPQLSTASLGTVNCTGAADVNATGITASAGGNGWDAAPVGTCTAVAQTARTYRVTVTLGNGQTVTQP
jgi:type IV pilus assembly protein PilA